ncbi:MAG: arginine repressor [Actinomycetota bacterium]|nr:arginine repressor [Actinomycetota bacterium]
MKKQRQEFIRKKIRNSSIRSQKELVDALKKEGFNVSQSTVSRDLGEIGFAKLRGENGKCHYEEIENEGHSMDNALKRLAPDFLLEAEKSGNIVVVKTLPGNAQGLAAALDRARLEGITGTVAGDDTIIVVCSENADASNIRKMLMDYAGVKQGVR